MSGYYLPKGLLAFAWHFCKPNRLAFILIGISPVLMLVENTLWPYFLGQLIDSIAQYGGDRAGIYQQVSPILWKLGISWLVLVAAFRGSDFWLSNIWPRYVAKVRLALFEAVSAHSHQYFADRFSGTLSNKISDMLNALTNLFFGARWMVVSSLASCLGVLVIIFWMLPSFAFVLLGWIIAHLSICYVLAKKADAAAQRNAEDKSTMSGKVVDVFTNIINVRLFGRQRYEYERLSRFQEIEASSHRKMLMTMSVTKAVVELPGAIMLASMVALLIRGWVLGYITSGDFVFIFYTSFNLLIGVWHLSMELPSIFREIGVARQALSLITEPYTVQNKPQARDLKISQGRVVFEKVCFAYGPGAGVFRDLTVDIRPGEKVGLVGFSGSGKSTFVNLLLRFYDVTSGNILVDGQKVSDVTHASLSQSIAMIPQDTTLFHRTLMDNIRYGRIDASEEEVIEAAKKAHCHEFIMEMPEQYETQVGERGVKLSGGQRQRIAIARAVLKNAPILILDEATSALDSVTEGLIQASLSDLMQNRTCIVIAHRLSTLTGMDRILVFDGGRIIEAGTHEQLMECAGHYARLWRLQMDGFVPEIEPVGDSSGNQVGDPVSELNTTENVVKDRSSLGKATQACPTNISDSDMCAS